MEKPHRIGTDKRFRTDHWLLKTAMTRLQEYTANHEPITRSLQFP